MSKLNSNYELISNKASNPVTTTPYIKHGEKWLDEMLNESDGRIDSVESGVAANTEAISQNTTNISTNTTNISGLDTRVTALEQGGGGGGGDNVGRIDRTEGATQHGEIFNMYTNDGDNKANRATGYMSHAEGVSTQASGACSHAEGSSTTASGSCSHAEGASTTAFGSYSHAEGFNTQATASGSHAEGNGARAFKEAAHAEGVQTTADGLYAHAEGNYTTASAEAAHAEGKNSIASGLYSHAEGEYTYAEEWGAHSEGKNTTASGKYSHAENSYSEALGENSHAEGNYTISSGYRTHTEGFHTKASGDNAHAEGYYTKASSNNQHVSGTANIEDKANKYAVIVGNGLWEGNESNAYTLDWQGNAWYAGDVTGNKDGEEYKLSDMKDKYTFPEGGIPASDLAEGVLPTVTDEYNPEGTAAVSGKAVAAAISAIPTPMQFKGTLGTGGTKTSLPTAEASNEGHTYRVITTGTYASQAAKVGDVFVSNGSAWIHIPAGDDAANSIVMTNYTSDKSSAGTSAIANTDTVTKAIGKVDNRLGNAETEIEKKVNKTSVSLSKEGGETTSVINVTDAKAQMAMVASIKGKTQKVVQLINDRKTWTNGSNVDTRTQFMPMIYVRENVSTANLGWIMQEITTATGLFQRKIKATYSGGAILLKHNGASKDINIVTNEVKITSGHSYIFSCIIKSCNPTAANGLSLENVMLFDITEMGLPDSTTLEQFNAAIKEYVPYGSYLWNAPVESVVSVGKNLATKKLIRYNITASGVIEVNSAYDIYYAKVEKGKNYAFTQIGTMVSGFFYNVPKTGEKTYDGVRIVYEGGSQPNYITAPITGYVIYRVAGGATTQVMINEGTTRLPYTPPYETTVLVPSEVRNCVGYGLSVNGIANVVDFENGTYTQNIGIMKLDELTWNYRNDGTSFAPYFWTEFSNKTIKVKGTVNDAQNILNAKYPTIGRTSPTVFVDKTICADGTSTAISQIQIKDSAYTTVAAFKESLKGQILLYEKYSPETKPLTDYIRPLPVEQGGTLTLVNEHNLDVNSVIKYKKEVN